MSLDKPALAIALRGRKIAVALGNKAVPITLAAPTISAADPFPVLGTLLTGVHGDYTCTPTSYTYRWLRDGVAIAGATALTYVAQAADVGKSITFEETPTNAIGTGAANVSAGLLVRPALGPVTASYLTSAVAGTKIADITGLFSGETVLNISPDDGTVAIISSGTALGVGVSAALPGTVNYTLTTSIGRTLTIALTLSTAPANALTINGDFLTINGDYLTIGA